MVRTPDPARWRSALVSQGRVADYKPFVMVDGEGVRCSLYVSGCLFACEGCFNRAAWSFRYGAPYDDALEERIVTDVGHPAVQGVSLLGGEPFLNTGVCARVVHRLRSEYGRRKDVWAWSGFTFEQLCDGGEDQRALLAEVDVLVDGPFQLAERDLDLPFRGSRNQRVLDIPASLSAGEARWWRPALRRGRPDADAGPAAST